MPTTYPGAIDDYDAVPESQAAVTAHRERHQDIEDAMEAVQTFVGVSSATDGTSIAGRVNQAQSDVFGLGLELDGTAPGGAVNQLRTGQHFAQNGARIHRFNDRMFVAAATQNDGSFPNVQQCWMDSEWVAGGFGTGPGASSLFYLANDTNPNSAIGVMSAVRTNDFTSANTTAIPVFGCAWNEHASLATKAYGGYFEAHRPAGSAGADTYGVEIDTRISTSTITPDPYTVGDAVALQLASGAFWNAAGQFDASCAVQIAGNPMRFKKGIVFRDDALTDLGGGVKEAIALPSGGILRQWISAGVPGPFVYFAATAAALSPSMTFGNLNLKVVETSTSAEQFRHTMVASAVNFIETFASTTGNPVRMAASGTDLNIDYSVEPKGTGRFKIGTASTAATTPASFSAARYLPIKDSSGTVYYVPLATAVW